MVPEPVTLLVTGPADRPKEADWGDAGVFTGDDDDRGGEIGVTEDDEVPGVMEVDLPAPVANLIDGVRFGDNTDEVEDALGDSIVSDPVVVSFPVGCEITFGFTLMRGGDGGWSSMGGNRG